MKVYLMVFIVLFNTACSLTPKQQPARHDFGVSTASSSAFTHADITVTTPDWLYNDCIHYRLLYTSATRLRCYNLDQWIAPPPDLFKQLLSHKLSSKHRLVIELSEFEQQFDSPNTARVVMQFVVNAYAAESEQAIATYSFHLQQTTAANAAGAVAGFSQLNQQTIARINQWLKGLH